MNPLLNPPNGTTFNCIIFFVLTNRYGHPAAEAVANIKDSGAKIYETTKCGQITIGYDKLPAMKPKMKQFYSGISIQAQNPGSG